MKRTNWFGKSFGPVASFSGMIILIVGLYATYYGLSGLVLVLFGFFIGFTDSSTTIDVRNKRVKYTNNIFGIIKIGKWVQVEKNMSIGIVRDNRVFRTYSRGNQILDIKEKAAKIYLFNQKGDPIVPIMQGQHDKNLAAEVDKLCYDLEIPIVIPKNQQQPI
jgi:hypothetical protein